MTIQVELQIRVMRRKGIRIRGWSMEGAELVTPAKAGAPGGDKLGACVSLGSQPSLG
jgi:hypothetical protein